MARLKQPETEKQKVAAAEGLELVLSKFTSKNDMARVIGVTRNTVSWWFTKGYVTGNSIERVASATGLTTDQIRPDLNMAE